MLQPSTTSLGNQLLAADFQVHVAGNHRALPSQPIISLAQPTSRLPEPPRRCPLPLFSHADLALGAGPPPPPLLSPLLPPPPS